MLDYSNTIPIDFLYFEIQHGAFRMTSKSSKFITNVQAGLISSSEECDRKRPNKITSKDHPTDLGEDHTGSESLVEEIHPICQDDPRPEDDDER